MSKVLLTGLSGNVGGAVADDLIGKGVDFVAGVRHIEKYQETYPDVSLITLDLEDPRTYDAALSGIDKVFLMRPPALTDVEGIFKPFIEACKKYEINQIVFLSLLGIEKNPLPPHYKIEKAILKSGIPYTFIRPSFFMQNLSTTHAVDIKERDELYIPCGNAKVSFIDTRDIGEIIGKVLVNEGHKNKAYTITGKEAIDYYKVAEVMTEKLGRPIRYTNPSLLKFRREMIKRGTKKAFATVMTVLYLTTKLGMANHVTDTAKKLLGREPRSIEDFVEDYLTVWC